jgi:hypothetical protein
VLIQLFDDKGISQPELAALIGAHTASKAIAQEANGIPYNGKHRIALVKRKQTNTSDRTSRLYTRKVGRGILLTDRHTS